MNKDGFTLIEAIISVVLLGITASMLISFFQTSFLESADPLNRLDDNYRAIQGIERINAHYRAELEANPNLDISMYEANDLSPLIGNSSGTKIKGEGMDFTAPDANRKVKEIAGSGGLFVRITSTRNLSSVITIIGN
ncbi:MAG: type II secretion system GspH family protein [Desulfobacterales bacterium]|nr:type II secretion system GspH family protein [Desulfobacterales bacterium]